MDQTPDHLHSGYSGAFYTSQPANMEDEGIIFNSASNPVNQSEVFVSQGFDLSLPDTDLVVKLQNNLEKLKKKSDDRKVSLKMLFNILTHKEKENDQYKQSIEKAKIKFEKLFQVQNAQLKHEILLIEKQVDTITSKFDGLSRFFIQFKISQKMLKAKSASCSSKQQAFNLELESL